MKINWLDYGPEAVLALVSERWGEKPFRGRQLLQWIYQRRVQNFDCMTDISQSFRRRLAEDSLVEPPAIVYEQKSLDGTIKWLLAVHAEGEPAESIETVFIPEKDRGTLCVSSQVGCIMSCRFCSTATQGFSRNLSTAQIIGQVWQAAHRLHALGVSQPITNVVLMGMGEPLLNLDAVLPALELMRHDLCFGLSKRRVTLSTSGVVPAIYRLAESSDVALAVSLHAPNDALRNELVPINRKYPIASLLEACSAYAEKKAHRRITIEYVMLKGVNDHPEQATQLGRLLEKLPCKINLIPFNPFPGAPYECSEASTIQAFQHRLMRSGFVTTIRKTRGNDIDAACGQLVGRVQDRTQRQARFIRTRIQLKETGLPEERRACS